MVKIYTITLLFLLLGFLPVSADAAALSFFPSSDSYGVGDTFSVNVYVESTDQAMNAASGVVSFPTDSLEVVSLSKTGSIFSLWIDEPFFSNSAGAIGFEGIVLNPGFTGASGKIITITFRAKSEGQASLSFSSGSVLANDGLGTSILNNLRAAVITIGSESLPQASSTEVASEDDTSPKFSWVLSKGSLDIRLFKIL